MGIFLVLLACVQLQGEELSTKRVVEVYPLALADFDASVEVARAIVSSDGKLVPDRGGNRLIMFDYPEKHEELRKALLSVRGPQYNIRIEVTFDHRGVVRSDSMGVQGGFRVGGVEVKSGDAPRTPTRVEINELEATRASLVRQELVVMSGARASLRIGTDIPYMDWFWAYGLNAGLWSGETRWRELGTSLLVEPSVVGQRIRLKLIPEFTYLLEGRSQTTVVEKLATELWVQNGEEMDLGGMPVSDQEFYSRFLVGYNHLGEKHTLHIKVKPTIEPLSMP